MSADQLSAVCSVLVVLLAGSEALPFIKRIKANGWGQLLIAVLRAVSSQKRK
jgi:hypothetical protein